MTGDDTIRRSLENSAIQAYVGVTFTKRELDDRLMITFHPVRNNTRVSFGVVVVHPYGDLKEGTNAIHSFADELGFKTYTYDIVGKPWYFYLRYNDTDLRRLIEFVTYLQLVGWTDARVMFEGLLLLDAGNWYRRINALYDSFNS